jgi:uncharacterized repeat protein (TIGR01451 family)
MGSILRIPSVVVFLLLFAVPASAQLVISEFRWRGPSGANDEFVEIMNNSAASHTVAGGGTGYALAASDGVARCVIPNGTVLPPRGRYLCVNSVAYSLASYPAGNGTTATGDATYTTNIPDNAGLALFSTSVAADFTLANRLDAVGSTSEANTLYKEGTGYPALTPFSIDHAFVRDQCGKGGSITTFGPCPSGGAVLDSNNNAADFIFVDTNGTSAGAGQRLGAPGPQNFSSPLVGTASMPAGPLDPCVPVTSPPNTVRDFTSDPPNNSTFGTLDLRARYTNNTGVAVTRLRFRVIDLTTFPAPSGFADLRPRTSSDVVVTVDRPPCGSGTSNITVHGTTLEQPPSQPNGGGFNSSYSLNDISLATPLANGDGVDVRFLLGIQQNGGYKIGLVVETLPDGVNTLHEFTGCTDAASCPANLAITKTDGVTTATPGGSVTYTITASNAGPNIATGATVADTFPASLTCTWTCVGAGGGTCTAAGSGNINDTVNLPVGGSMTYTASCTIAPGATGSLVNTATVSAPAGVTDPTPANNSATDTDTLSFQANLAITKTDGVTTATPGGSVTYTITASNSGPSNATGAAVADTFAASLTCTWTCVGAGGGTCTAAGSGNISNAVNLPAGGSVTYTASCTIAPGATGSLVNTATVSAPAGVTDPTPANNTATDTDTLGASADLAITKIATPDPVVAGQHLAYTITVTNSGPSTAASVTLSDPLPASATFVSLTAPGGWSCTTPPVGAGGTISCTIASLGAAGSGVFTLTTAIAPATAAGTVTNTATVSSSTPDPTPGNNSATASTLVNNTGLACDVNGDGSPEFITGAGPGGGPHVRVWSLVGSDLVEVAGFFADDPAFPGGVFLTCRDLTGDGVGELITAKGPGGSPDVRIWSLQGNNLIEVARFFAYDPAFPGGVSVAAGDVTGDGVNELITGAGPGGGPHVRVWTVTGSSVSELGGFFAYDPAFPGGVSVAVGDVTGDGVSELITGAGAGGGPHVRVWSVAGGSLTELGGFFAYHPAFPGGVSVAVGDVTGDGVGDLITGAGPGGGPHVRVWSLVGSDLVEVAGFFAYDPAFPGGVFVAAGDVTGDGVAELITGAGPGGGPHVRVWSLTPAGIVEVTGFFAYNPAFPGGVRVGR